jgi:subtilisin family serine protease
MSAPVRVGIVDSGINPRDRQVGSVAGGIGIRFRDGAVAMDDDWQDALGHGTAVAATIRELAPRASLYSIRVFHRALEAHVEALLYAIEWAARERLDLLNLSLGCDSFEREGEFREASARAREAGVVLVSAADALPGALPGSFPVRSDPELEEDHLRFEDGVYYAAPWARRRGELPREKNLHGTSFAVARVTGLTAASLSLRRA